MMIHRFSFLVPLLFVSACVSASDVGVKSRGPGDQPRVANWTCTDGATLTIQNNGSNVQVTDSRGADVNLPADPPGQNIRYGRDGFALVYEGTRASWFDLRKMPVDCQR